MYKAFIKEWLIGNQSRVYSLITKTYGSQLLDLKPTLFRKWLAKEIDLPEEKINLSSLNSALSRYKKSLEKEKKREKTAFPAPKMYADDTVYKGDNFTFSDVQTTPEISKTIEL